MVMQAYTSSFANVYNKKWAGFATRLAPGILALYQSMPAGAQNRVVLDVCCGTGQLAAYFLAQGYQVIGIDASEGMLRHAVANNIACVQAGQARFIQADAAAFALDARVGLAVSTFDALNHLEDERALRACFACVNAVLIPGGVFVFDLNTRAGLRLWSGISVEDTLDAMIVNRGFYDEAANRAAAHITGFLRSENGSYERFEELAYETAFDLNDVKGALLHAGWKDVYFARGDSLNAPLSEPESEGRVFVVATK
jgi:SAM-dependent methyltransferase